MLAYQTKPNKLSGTSYAEVIREARLIYHKIEKSSRRKPYLRSAYFDKEKVFLNSFWDHLNQKNWRDRTRRLRFLPCAFELIRFSKLAPSIKFNPNNKNERLYRFTGIVGNEIFHVQIKEKLETESKYFMSVFPPE